MSSPSVLPLVLLLVGGWLIWWGLRRRTGLGKQPTGWRRMAGTVIDAGDGVAVPPRIEYRTPDGRRLRVPGPLATPFAVGDDVAVLVDPSDFTRAQLDLTEREAERVVKLLLTVGAVLLVLGVLSALAFL